MTFSKPPTDPSVFATYVRGGTSKAVFFQEEDIPPPGPIRDAFLIRIMGSPDPNQIDGMGGTRIVTSKAAIIRKSDRPDADVDYTFVQVGIDERDVSYSGNCGNISTAVGPYAINEGLVDSKNFRDGKRLVRIYNTGQDVVLVAHIPEDQDTGRVIEKGDYTISGCPGTAAEILMDYSKTAKSSTLQPSGKTIDLLECTFGEVEVSFCQVGNPILFVDAGNLNMAGNESAESLNHNKDVLAKVSEIRGRFAQLTGKCDDWRKFDEISPMLPMVAAISKSTSRQGHIQARLFLDGHCHQAMAGTGAMCTTAVSRIKGSVVNRLLDAAVLKNDQFLIQHPSGFFTVKVGYKEKNGLPEFDILAFGRTARYILQGQLIIPADFQDKWSGNAKTSATVTSDIPPVNKTTDEANSKHSSDPVTAKLVDFVKTLKRSDISKEAEGRLRQCLLDFVGITFAGAKFAESSPHYVKGVQAVTQGFPETHAVIGIKDKFPAQYAALLTGAFCHSLDFDDTHTNGIIHVEATIITTAITEAQSHPDLSYEDFIVALAAGYEVSVRIAMALGASSWHRGFHNTSIAGIYGAVAVLSKLRNLSTEEITNAFGLAVSFASGSMQYLENGAWNKRLHPAKAAHDAFIVVAQAQAGVLGAALPLEGKYGLIAIHTDAPYKPIPTQNLKSHWELVNTGLKPYPGCRVTHTSIELAALVSAEHKAPVKSIHIIMDPVPFPMVGVANENKVHPKDVVDAQFSAFYQAAVAWVYGDKLGWGVYDHVNDQKVQDICSKITIEQQTQENDLITHMIATFEDGTIIKKTLQRPKWQQPERPPTREEVEEKFISLAEPILGKEKVPLIAKFVSGSEKEKMSGLLILIS